MPSACPVTSQKQELENKLNISSVNTGTFDPTSDDPAGQKSIIDLIVETDLNTRYSRLPSNDLSGAFANLPYYYSGKFHLLRSTQFLDKNKFNLDFLVTNSAIEDFDYSGELDFFFNNAISVSMAYAFLQCTSLKTISANYSIHRVMNLEHSFDQCYSLKTIKLRNFPVSFDISYSTAFEESDLVEIIGNLFDLTGKTSQTLTMGATNLAKLTDAEKAVAVNKNWVLA